MTTPLIAIDDVKKILPIREGNTSFDAQLEALILVATKQIEHHCRREFAAVERTEYYTPRASENYGYDLFGSSEDGLKIGASDQSIILRAAPVADDPAIAVYYDPSRVWGDDTLIPAERIFVESHATSAVLNFNWPTRVVRNSLKIVYTAGYSVVDDSLSSSIPEDLKQAAIFQTAYMFTRSLPEEVGTNSHAEDGQQVETERSAIVREAVALLAPYRRVLTGRG